jgi:hypothetical protein
MTPHPLSTRTPGQGLGRAEPAAERDERHGSRHGEGRGEPDALCQHAREHRADDRAELGGGHLETGEHAATPRASR